MEAQAPALPVPPLTDEQKDQLKPWAEQAQADRDKDANPALARLLACGVPEIVLHYEAQIANYKRREAKGVDTWLTTKQFITDQGNELSASKSEVGRLSRLLEEERRTVASEHLYFRVECLSPSIANTENAWSICSGATTLERACEALADWQRARPEMKGFRIIQETTRCIRTDVTPGTPAAAPCQRDCQKCEKGESRTGSELLDLMLCPSQQPNPHKDPNFLGCWGNSDCPCDSKAPEDCPLYLAPEPENGGGGAGVGLQGEEGGGRG